MLNVHLTKSQKALMTTKTWIKETKDLEAGKLEQKQFIRRQKNAWNCKNRLEWF